MPKIEFYDLPEGLNITQMEKGPKEFREFSEKEIEFLKRSIAPGSSTLDVGCGHGKHIAILSAKAKKVVGIDSSRMMVEKAKEYLRGLKNTEVFLEDAERMHFRGGEFDFVICTRNTFGNLPNRQKVLREMKRVLNPGGKMFIGVYSQQAKGLQLEYYKRNGIRVTRITKDAVYAFPDLKSERFSKRKLKKIFEAEKLDARIIRLNSISFECIVSGRQVA